MSSERKRFEEGVYYDIPADDYHAAEGLSHSMLKHLTPPARLPVYMDEDESFKPTDEMIVGTIAHDFTLEPNKPPRRVVIEPSEYVSDGQKKNWNNNATVCKEWHAQQRKSGVQIVLKQDKYDTAVNCAKAVLAFAKSAEILRQSKTEVSCFTTIDGLPCKCRLDIVPHNKTFFADLKTVPKGGASEDAWASKMCDQEYFLQPGFYIPIWKALTGEHRQQWVNIVVEKAPPYLVAVHAMSFDDIALGMALAKKRMGVYARCMKTGVFPGYGDGIKVVRMSDWDRKRIEKEIYGSE